MADDRYRPDRLRTISLDVARFSLAVNRIAAKARRLADRARTNYMAAKAAFNQSPIGTEEYPYSTLPQLVMEARLYTRLAVDAGYIRDVRLPLLPPDIKLKVKIPVDGYADFSKASNNKPFEVYDMLPENNWFDNLRRATDKFISADSIADAAKTYNENGAVTNRLVWQVNDEHWKACAVEVLRDSPHAAGLVRQAQEHGYEFYFVDLRPFCIWKADLRPKRAIPGTDGLIAGGRVFIDSYNDQGDIYRAIKLTHECAHAKKFHAVLGYKKPRAQAPPPARFRGNADRYVSTAEAFCVGTEYITGYDLIQRGRDAGEVTYALDSYALDSGTIDLLINEPFDFIRIVSRGEMVRKLWDLRASERRSSNRLTRELSQIIGKLPGHWGDRLLKAQC